MDGRDNQTDGEDEMRLEQYINEGIKSLLKPLADEAKKHDNYEDFEKAFTVQIKRGEYWHVTDNPNFVIDPKKGPRDMSSMASGKMNSGELMVTSHLEYWSDYYGKERPYAVLIDLSKLPLKAYNQVSRGFGNEFYISKSWMSKVKVVKVFPMKKALALSDRFTSSGPQSREELREFWNKVKGINEGWYESAKGVNGGVVDIFKNPTKKDFRELNNSKYLRFVAVRKTKSLYICDGFELLHTDIWDSIPELGRWNDKNLMNFDRQLMGIALGSGTKWVMDESSQYDEYGTTEEVPFMDDMKKMYKWVNKWIKIDKYFDDYGIY